MNGLEFGSGFLLLGHELLRRPASFFCLGAGLVDHFHLAVDSPRNQMRKPEENPQADSPENHHSPPCTAQA